jgi:uncharacterized membrane protein YbhN (UPF0104 family)
MTTMLATDQAIAELPQFDVRALARRAAPALLLVAGAVTVVLLAGGRAQGFVDAMRRVLDVSPAWTVAAAAFELLSLAAYIALMSLIAGRATARIGTRESAQITLAGAAATRLLPTAGAGGVALALWTLRRAGLQPRAATRTLLVFMVILYSVFLAAIVASGAALALGIAHARGATQLAALPALAALAAMAVAVGLGLRPDAGAGSSRLRAGGRLLGESVREASGLVRRRDARLLGAIGYWAFDAAVLWAMLHAFGAAPVLPAVALAYLVGQLANTIPIPGSVSGGMTGALIALGVPAELALPAVLAYRAIATWLPSPLGVAAIPGLRATVTRWGAEDGRENASSQVVPAARDAAYAGG